MNVQVADRGDQLKSRLHEEIHRFNEDVTGFRDARSLSLRLEDASGDLVAGLTGWTWGRHRLGRVLWVRAESRGTGVGGTLLAAAEREASARGCASMVLSTHSFQGPDFYRARGYVECGRFPDYPAGHSQLHLTKSLLPT